MSQDDELYWEPYEARFATNPWPVFQRLRDEAPLYYNAKHDFYAVSRADDLEQVATDWETFSSARGNILEILKSGIEIPPGTLIFEDPPIHDIHRRLLVRVFTPRRINALEGRIRRFCEACLDPLVGEKRFDLIQELGAEMPMRVIGMMLGIPDSDQPSLRAQADEHLRTEDGGKMELDEGAIISNEELSDYISWRAKNPSDDLITDMLTTEFEDENGVRRTLSQEEALTYVTVVAGAGNETTGRLIGWSASELAKQPEQRAELVADPSLIPNAVEEVLRLESPGPFLARYVTKSVEFHGQTVPEGSAIMGIIASANRDERRFPDPDRLDIHRKVSSHFSFSLGPHYCLGAALARMEGRIALEELLKRWPTWEIDYDDAKFAQTSTVRGWERLPMLVG